MAKFLYFFIFYFLFSVNIGVGQDSTYIKQLEERLRKVEERLEKEELEKIIREAESRSEKGEKTQEVKVFRGGQRALQALNPEISVACDAYGQFIGNEDQFTEQARSGAHFRVAEVQIQSELDPFSLTKIILEFTPDGVEFAEAYLTWNRILPNISLTAGKFRQQFGVVNRWHAHALDQFEFPLALTTMLGEEGLNQMGLSLDWLMPAFLNCAHSLTLQVTNGQNEHLFSGEAFSFPTGLAHYKIYRDLTRNSYIEWGISGMVGRNDFRGYDPEGNRIMEARRTTKLLGMDWSFLWEPVDKARYRSFLWRTELYFVDKPLISDEKIRAFGGYSYAEYKFNERWHAGIRFDYTQPFQAENAGLNLYQIVPYLTWWQSPWVKLRLQYDFLDGNLPVESKHWVRFQITWAIGPHKHERY
ncbi:MAG: hypothetical protein Kow0042_02390 [Calditrichia bacterium]